MNIELMEHNLETYEKLVKFYETENIAALVQATGTGKTYIALNYMKDFYENKRIVIIVPRKALQDYWLKKIISLPNKSIDIITYQSLLKLSYEDTKIIGETSSLIIFDELHHCGAKKWGISAKILIEEAISYGNKILGITATPIRSLDNNRNIVDELFEGHQINGITLKDALINDVLPPFKYVAALYGVRKIVEGYKIEIRKSKVLSKFDKEYCSELTNRLLLDEESISNIKMILDKHLDLTKHQKIILFMENISSKCEINDDLIDWFPMATIYDIDSTKSNMRCQDILESFNCADTGIHILKVVDKLNEGVHINGITSLIMLRKTASDIIFLQQLGRGLDVANNSTDNDITVFDLVGNHVNISRKISMLGMFNDINTIRNTDNKKCIVLSDYTINTIELMNNLESRLNISFWTEDEINILKDYYPTEGINVYKRFTNKTESQCKSKANHLGIYIISFWTEDEINILKEFYPLEGRLVYKRCIGKTGAQCQNKAYLLGLKRIDLIICWTEDEINILKEFYPLEGINVYKRIPGKTKWYCQLKANELQLKRINPIIYWTNEETVILKKYFITEGRAVYKRISGKTAEQCGNRAVTLGLKKNGIGRIRWTNETINILKKYYPSEGNKVCKRIVGATEKQCQGKAKQLQIKYQFGKLWDNESLKILKKYYALEGPDIYKRFPGKTKTQCQSKAKEFGLLMERHFLVWSVSMDNILKEFYPTEGSRVSKRLSGVTAEDCRYRARMLKIYYISFTAWTDDETVILKEFYPLEGNKVYIRLPGKTKTQCQSKASDLRLKKLDNRKDMRYA